MEAWLGALASVFALIMALFGRAGAVDFGLAVLGFGAGLALGQGAGGTMPRKPEAAGIASPPLADA